jgi:hypothetical protein
VYGSHGKARAHFLEDWQMDSWRAGDAWQLFVRRAAAGATAAIAAAAIRRGAEAGAAGDRYFLAVCTEDDYPEALVSA